MKIGIIVFSQTGNTLSVAEKMKERLLSSGHSVQLEKIESEGAVEPGSKTLKITRRPDIKSFDALVFAAPVMAFSLNPVMKLYLQELPEAAGKKTVCFITQAFPKPWLGGSNALRKMRILCGIKKMDVVFYDGINWKRSDRDSRIEDLISKTASFFEK